MLTVRHIAPNGFEMIVQCEQVSFTPEGYIDDANRARPEVFIEKKGETMIPISDGEIYVMNDAGKTVASYHLAYPSPVSKKPEG
jgi:hypothetical protein